MTRSSIVRPIPFAQLPDDLQRLLEPRVQRLGYLGAFFSYAAHQPEALTHFIGFTETLKERLPFRLVEVIALTIASLTDNLYERIQHERLALRSGFTLEEVAALVTGGDAGADGLAANEQAAARLARCLVRTHGHDCADPLSQLQDLVGEKTAVGCLMMAARYLAHAAMANTWQLLAPVTSPLAGAGDDRG